MIMRVTVRLPDVGYKWRVRELELEALSTLTRPELEKIIRCRYCRRAQVVSVREDRTAVPNPILKI